MDLLNYTCEIIVDNSICIHDYFTLNLYSQLKIKDMSIETTSKKLDQLLEQVEKINAEVKSLKGKVMDEKVYKMTEKQMKEFISGLYYAFSEWNQNEISNVEFSDSAVNIEVDSFVIIPTIDSTVIADEIESYTEVPTEIQMMNMASEVMEDLGIELVEGTCE